MMNVAKVWIAVGLAWALAACSEGSIDDGAGPGAGASGAAGGGPGGGGGGAAAGTGGAGGNTDPSMCIPGVPATTQIPRLLNRQYEAVVRDLL